MTRCIQALEEAGRSYVQLSGSWAQRFEAAHREIDRRFFSRETPGKTFQAASEKPRDSHLEKGEAGP